MSEVISDTHIYVKIGEALYPYRKFVRIGSERQLSIDEQVVNKLHDELATKEAQLKIAVEALEIYMLLGKAPDEAKKALEEIEKMGKD